MNKTPRHTTRAIWLALAVLLLVAATPLLAAPAFVPGDEGDGASYSASVSAEGRFITFVSDASNLVAGDDNALPDIYLHDRQTGETLLLSVGPQGEAADGFSEAPVVSADGRFVAFHSVAANLVPDDTNLEADVFVYDREAAELSRVSVRSDGAQAAGASYEPSISADGRYVAFLSSAINLDPADTDPANDVFIHDRQTGETALVSFDAGGERGAGYADAPSISADGRRVAFSSASDDLVDADTNEYEDVFVRDLDSGDTWRVSVRSDGDEVFADSYDPAISADGLTVAFWSYAANLTDDELVGWNVFVHELPSGETTLASVGEGGEAADHGSMNPALSGDGTLVAFESEAANLTAGGDTNDEPDIFLRDREHDETVLLSRTAEAQGNGPSSHPAISPDGRYVVFQSAADNLVDDDQNDKVDIFLLDRTDGSITRVSVASGTAAPDGYEIFMGVVIR